MGEPALMQPIGGPEVMASQLERIASEVENRLITVQVLPLNLPGHAAMGVPFTLFDLRDGATFAYIDTLTGGLYLDEVGEIGTYRSTWDQLTANALDFHRSVSVIMQKVREHRS